MKVDNVLRFAGIALVVLTSAVSGTATSSISISAEVTSASITFEGKDTLIVRLSWEGEPFLYQIDDFPVPDLEKLKILGSSSSVATSADSTLPSGEATVRTFTYVLEPTDFGSGVIEPLNITATNRITDEKIQLQTGRLTVAIAKPLPEEKPRGGSGTIVLIIAVAVLAISAVVFLVVFRRRKPEPPADPAQVYLDVLEEIKREATADGKLFYARLYRLLIQYLENEKDLKLSGRTGEEVLRQVAMLDDDVERTKLSGWLDKALKIKFRPESPSSGDINDSYNAVHSFFESKAKK